MAEHLGYKKNAPIGKMTSNSRNGSCPKRIKGDFGHLDITVPRDRDSSFEPVIIPKEQSHFTGFDDKIITLHAQGMAIRNIQSHLKETYGVEDIFTACVDGLKGFPEAIEMIFPETQIQLCIVHMVRHSLNYVSWKQRKKVAADLKTIYNYL